MPIHVRAWLAPSVMIAVLFAVLAAVGCAGLKTLEGAGSGVVVLVDFSKSFAPLTVDDGVALERVGKALVRMAAQRLDQPVKVYWSAIGNRSHEPFSPCGPSVLFQQRLTGTSTPESGDLRRVTDLSAWMTACVKTVIGLSANNIQEYTDISGAVHVAANNLKDVRDDRILAIYSDFAEDIPRGAAPSGFTLNGERVVMVWRPGTQDHLDIVAFQARLRAWEERLMAAGATSVCQLTVAGLTERDVEPCLWRPAGGTAGRKPESRD